MSKTRLTILLISPILIITISVFAIFPTSTKILKDYRELNTNQQTANANENLNKNLIYLNSNGALAALAQKVLTVIPKQPEESGLENSLTELIQTNGLTLGSLKIDQNAKTANTIPFDLTVTGGFTGLHNFIYQISQNKRLMTINDLTLHNDNQTLTLELKGKAHYKGEVSAKKTSENIDLPQSVIDQINAFVEPKTTTKTTPPAGFGRSDPFSSY